MRAALLVGGIAALAAAAPAPATTTMWQSTIAIRGALDQHGRELAAAQGPGWGYAGQNTIRGDYRRLRVWLVLVAPDDPDVDFALRVTATATRCPDGSYVVADALTPRTCTPAADLLVWDPWKWPR